MSRQQSETRLSESDVGEEERKGECETNSQRAGGGVVVVTDRKLETSVSGLSSRAAQISFC